MLNAAAVDDDDDDGGGGGVAPLSQTQVWQRLSVSPEPSSEHKPTQALSVYRLNPCTVCQTPRRVSVSRVKYRATFSNYSTKSGAIPPHRLMSPQSAPGPVTTFHKLRQFAPLESNWAVWFFRGSWTRYSVSQKCRPPSVAVKICQLVTVRTITGLGWWTSSAAEFWGTWRWAMKMWGILAAAAAELRMTCVLSRAIHKHGPTSRSPSGNTCGSLRDDSTRRARQVKTDVSSRNPAVSREGGLYALLVLCGVPLESTPLYTALMARWCGRTATAQAIDGLCGVYLHLSIIPGRGAGH